jgi:hypothetical protein
MSSSMHLYILLPYRIWIASSILLFREEIRKGRYMHLERTQPSSYPIALNLCDNVHQLLDKLLLKV